LDRQVERHRGCLFLGTNDTGTSHQRFFFGLRADEAPGFFGSGAVAVSADRGSRSMW
jgi:hypothetical protein